MVLSAGRVAAGCLLSGRSGLLLEVLREQFFSIPFSIVFWGKWGHALWGLQHSFQAMEKFDSRIEFEGLNHNLHRAGTNE